ncbi:long-chain acyl-CoA synthetase [Pseudohyphozyma bogoriensis]|nr:long-chain acyl-CoA synthetase [Pseudohyphozyma bogoriensis]
MTSPHTLLRSQQTQVDPSSKPTGEGQMRRGIQHPQSLITGPPSSPDVKVLADVLPRCVAKFGDWPALGWRDTVNVVEEEKEVTKVVGGKEVKEKKTWKYFQLSDYQWCTYSEFYDKVKTIGSALAHTGHNKDTIFNIFAPTAPNWQVFANGCAYSGVTFATAYDSLGEEGLEHSINEPSVYGMFTNAALLGTIAAVVPKTPSLKVLIWDGKLEDVKKGALEAIKAASPELQIYTMDQFLELGKQNPKEKNAAGPDDIACIMYTSGSTGAPKGVMITNANIIATLGAVEVLLPHVVKAKEVYIAYLPLAHIMEFAVEMCFMFVGGQMGYGSPKTLTDASVRNCAGDIRALRPTIMVGVPAVFELIRKGIAAKVKATGGIKAALFNAAVSLKRNVGLKGILPSIADAVVFNAVKQGTGGRLKFALSGGAQISKETQEFLSIALVTIIQGYGLTESTAMCALLPPEIHRYAAVGGPVPSVEIKLVDFPEANYFSTSNPPQGEVWVRGASVSKGYYKRPDTTKENFTEDGWFMTGDIGQWNTDGTLSIIDRKKNLVKLAGGEYIALERLESVYRACAYVANICLYGDTQANRAMAVIFPHEANIKGLVSEKGLAKGSSDLEVICADEGVRKAVLDDLNATGRKAGLKPLEALQCVVLTPEEWTPQNGLLTAAQKLQRKAIQQKYKSEIDAVYP